MMAAGAESFEGFRGLPVPDGFGAGRRHRLCPDTTVMNPDNLRELTKALRRGDEDAFNRFYALYSLRLYKHLLVLAKGDEGVAREVLQVTVIKLTKRFEVFDDERTFWAWLCSIARNSYIDHYRKRRRRNNLVPLEELITHAISSGDSEDRLLLALRSAMDELPPVDGELLRAVYVDQRPLKELAAETGQTYKSLESRLTRLRQKVKAQLLLRLRHEQK
jgi:RNA polymerase sigma-70 factor (ECF subfamily)